QLQGERQEDLAHAQRRALPERHPRKLILVLAAREETVGVGRIVREQPLQLFERDIARVRVEQLARAIRCRALHGSLSRSRGESVTTVGLPCMTSDPSVTCSVLGPRMD